MNLPLFQSNFKMKIVQTNVVANEATLKMLRQNATRARTGIRKAFHKMGQEMLKIAKENIDGGKKTGRFYYINPALKGVKYTKKLFRQTNPSYLNYNALLKHRASAAGEYPAKITGELKSAINFSVRGARQLEYGASAISVATEKGVVLSEYPKFLEEGTKKMAPRPYLGNSIRDNSRNNTVHLEREIFKAITKP